MLKEGYKLGQVTAALRTSPSLASKHVKAEMYIKETLKKEHKTLNLLAP